MKNTVTVSIMTFDEPPVDRPAHAVTVGSYYLGNEFVKLQVGDSSVRVLGADLITAVQSCTNGRP